MTSRNQFVVAVFLLLLVSCRPEVATPTPTVVPSNVRVTSLTWLGKGSAVDVAWSPDARMLALSSSLGVYLYDGPNLEQIRHLETDAWETRLAFSPDGSLLASLSDQGIWIWQTQTGDVERVLGGRGGDVTSIVFSPTKVQDDFVLAAGHQNGLVRLWQVTSGRSVSTLQGLVGTVTDLAFSPDGSLIAAGTETGEITLWSVLDDTRTASIGDYTAAIVRLFFLSDDKLGSISADGQIGLWDVSGCAESAGLCGQSLGVVSEGAKPVSAASFVSNSNLLLALGMRDGGIRLWWDPADECSGGAPCWLQAGFAQAHQTAVMGLAFSSDGEMLVSLHQDNVVQLWQTEACVFESQEVDCRLLPLDRLSGYTSSVESVVLMSDGLTVVSGHSDGKIRVWQMTDLADRWNLMDMWSAHAGATLGVALSADENVLASIGDDNAIRVWRLGDKVLLQTIKGHTWPMTDVAFSADGNIVATASCDKTVKLWRTEDGTLVDVLDHPACVRSIDFSTDGQLLVTGAEDGVARIWKMASGDVVQTLEGHEGAVWSVTFSPDEQFVVSGAADRTVRIWSVGEKTEPQVFKGHTARVTSVRFSPDGAFVISGGKDGTMRVWQIEGGMLLYTLNHNGAVNDLDISNDGTLLASGVDDGTVRLWQMEDD